MTAITSKFKRSNRIKMHSGDRIYTVIIYIVLVFVAFATLFPFLDVVLTSITPTVELAERPRISLSFPNIRRFLTIIIS